jgi:hypothetical protein
VARNSRTSSRNANSSALKTKSMTASSLVTVTYAIAA